MAEARADADADINGEPGGCRYDCRDILELVDDPADIVSGEREELPDIGNLLILACWVLAASVPFDGRLLGK